jgi:hypothetical protein
MDDEDEGPWFVRVIENKVSIGIYACTELRLADLIDEVTEPDLCEYKKLEPGGFVFGGEYALHALSDDEENEAPYLADCRLTESWDGIYKDEGLWRRMDTPFFDNDE